MSIVGEKLDFSHAGIVLLQVRDELARADFPNSDVTFHAAGADELAVGAQADSCDTSLVRILNLPEQLGVVSAECSDSTIRPARNDNLVGADSADGEQNASLISWCGTACKNRVIV